MIKFREYSQVRGLGMERYYSEYLEQREYGIKESFKYLKDLGKKVKDDAKKIGWKRSCQLNVGKARRSKAAELERNISDANRDIEGGSNILNANMNILNRKVNNPDINNKLTRKAKESGASVLDMDITENQSGVGAVSRSKDLTKKVIKGIESRLGKEAGDKIRSAKKEGTHVIFHPKNSGDETLAHEIGHVINSSGSSSRRDKRINSLVRLGNLGGENASISDDKLKSQKGLIRSLARKYKGDLVNLEEANATRKGLNLLRDLGASKNEMETAKYNLSQALRVYKGKANKNYMSPLRNSLQIPSRRKLTPNDPGWGRDGGKNWTREEFNKVKRKE